MEPNSPEDDIVYVPVPRRLLPVVYQSLAAVMTAGPSDDLENQVASSGKRNIIDLVIPVAISIGADRHSVTLEDLHAAYLRAYPGIGKGETRASLDATMNYHCINMRSRFPDASQKQKRADWNTRPVFKRVRRAQYMLLSLEEVEAFHFLLERNYPNVYADEYEADLLLQWFRQQKEE
jgi:hypothetical protein